jgi:hypothetical protein
MAAPEGARMTGPTAAHRLFDFADNPRESLRYFEAHAGEFDEFVEALAFFEDHDALLYGFAAADPRNPSPNNDPRFHWPATARLVLRDRQGAELWLGGCDSSASQRVLRMAKFPEHQVKLVFSYRILHLDKRHGVVEARKPPGEETSRLAALSRRWPAWHSTAFLVDGTPTLLVNRTLTGELLERWQAEGQEWAPTPETAELHLDDDEAAAAGLRYPGTRAQTRNYPPVYNLTIRDASGRELWLDVPVVVDGRPDRRALEATRALLTACGFDLGDASSFLRQVRGAWRARHDGVLRFHRQRG